MIKRRLIWIIVCLAAVLLVPAMPALADGDFPGNGTTIWGEDYTVEAGETVEGDLVVINGDVIIEQGGTVNGSIVVWGGSADIEGTVMNDLVVTNGDIYLGNSASIEGNVVCSGGCDLEKEAEASIDGSIIENMPIPPLPNWPLEDGEFTGPVQVNFSEPSWFIQTVFDLARRIITIVLVAAIATLLGLMLPQSMKTVGQTIIKAPVPSLGYGFLTMLAGLTAIVLLAITICLSPIAFLAGVALFAAGLYGWIGFGGLIGQKLLDTLNVKEVSPAWSAGLGTLIITTIAVLVDMGLGLVCCCLQPFIWLMVFVIVCAGLGSVVLTRFGTQAYMSTGIAPVAPAGLSEAEDAEDVA